MAKKNGRPRREIDFEQLDAILCTGVGTLEYCAERQLITDKSDVTSVSIKSMGTNIERKIRERYDCTFIEYKRRKQEGLQISIVNKQIALALGGHGNPTMLIWLGKNKCGQADKIEERVEVTKLEWDIGYGDEDDQAEASSSN